MKPHPLRLLLLPLLVACLAAPGAAPTATAGSPGPPPMPCTSNQTAKLIAPSGGKAYHSAYFSMKGSEVVYTDQWIGDWIAKTGKQPAMIVFSNHWGHNGKLDGPIFPQELVEMMWRNGALPDVRMMPWTRDWDSKGPDPVISMGKVARGDYDKQLRKWFTAAAATGIPFMIEFGVEVNGKWFPWNGLWNGGGTKNRYGSPSYPDGPERFIAAYRHVHDVADAMGADDLTWAFHVDVGSYPHDAWNQPAMYYPGDGYVDWVTFSDYGEQLPTEDGWWSFASQLGTPGNSDSTYSKLRAIAPSKPFGVIEFSVTEDPPHDKAQWVSDAYDSLTPPGPAYDVDVASFWSEKWRNGNGSLSDLRVDSSPAVLQAYRDAIADPFFVGVPQFSCT